MLAAVALTQQRVGILPRLFYYIIPDILDFFSIRSHVKRLADMGSQMTALMTLGLLKLLCGGGYGYNHHRFPIPKIGICNSGIHFPGAHVVIGCAEHFPVTSDGIHVVDYLVKLV